MGMTQDAQGFTLIEALVAMAVLAVASAGLIQATEAHIDLIRGLQTRAVASWVAENRMVELRVLGTTALPTSVDMLGRRWRVASTRRPSDDPDLAAVDVAVSESGAARPVATLHGFVDTGATQ